jgi:drug/metabolite transporter superfamily protein YnfA
MSHDPGEAEVFRREAAAARIGLARELWDFLRENKKWWLLPILAALAIFAVLAVLGGTGLAPFIYTVF